MGAVAPERCLAIPGVLPEQVPAAMSLFDISFDPAGTSPWRLGRSQLRWLEAGAWGLPFVGDPRVYPDLQHGMTGFHASDPIEIARTILHLVDDPLLRAAVGGRARRRIEERHTMEAVAPQWIRALEAVAA
jgi:glycosyltransferase involved in cell wall biosynthesis